MVIFLLWVAVACRGPEMAAPPRFVEGGLIHESTSLGGTPIGNSRTTAPRWFLQKDLLPGSEIWVDDEAWEVPAKRDCVPLFSVGLGDVRRHIAQGGSAPDTAIAWDPSGTRIAVGTFLGEVLVLDAWDGSIIAQRRFSETMVKQVAWSQDGASLYVAEQSPDAFLWSLSPIDLSETWSVPLAKFVGSSPLPAANIYGVYTLPAAYDLRVLHDGSLLVIATHAWNDAQGTRINQSQILRFSNEGEVLDVWPETPMDAVMFRAFVSDNRAAIPVSKSSLGPPPIEAPVGGLLTFDLDTFKPIASIQPTILEPWFTNTFVWEGVSIQKESVLLGLGDGRVSIWGTDGTFHKELEAGSPIKAGPVPIAASVGSAFFHGSRAVYQTSETHIPFGAAAPDLQPPTFHPRANTIFMAGADGGIIWNWTSAHALAGISLSPDGRTMIAGTTKLAHSQRQDLFGALIFDMGMPAEEKTPQLRAFCRTESPVFFRTSSSKDGRVAVAEHPFQVDGEPAVGHYRLTVFR